MPVWKILGSLSLFLGLAALSGCSQKKPVLSEFSIDVERGGPTPELVIRSREKGSLQDVNVDVQVLLEDGNTLNFKRTWSFWDEPKKIDLPKGAKVEKVEMAGSATRVVKNQGQICDIRYMERFH